jgi:bifunctional DNase/RNase
MVLMRLHELHRCGTHDATVVVLEDVAQSRRLTFSADRSEAQRLADAVTRGPRACHPIFDFVRALLRALGTAPARVVLEDVDGRGLGAFVVIRHGETDMSITCYPPDAVAIALREGLSIYATPAALDHAKPIAQPDDVTRWLQDIRPEDFSA